MPKSTSLNAEFDLVKMRAAAAAAMSQWFQYNGRFDAMIPVRIKKSIRTKMGQAFDKSEIAIADAAPNDDGSRTVWSVKNTVLTRLLPKDIVDIAVTA